MTDSTNRILGNRYQLLDEIGSGGMGTVYRALDRLTGQSVALKQVNAPDSLLGLGSAPTDSDGRLALAQEFQVLASLRHPHIISVLDYGFDEQKQPYFVMELLEKPETILQTGLRQPLATRIDLIVQTLQALAYLHRHGILHRDLKPGNILTVNGQVKVLDFGLASMRDHNDEFVRGTLAYMAPEMLLGQGATEAADLYAVGVIAFQLLTGKYPYGGSDRQQLMDSIISGVPDLSPLLKTMETTVAFSPLRNSAAEAPTITLDRTIAFPEQSAGPVEAHTHPNADKTSETSAPNLAASAASSPDQHGQIHRPPAESQLSAVIGVLLAKSPDLRYSEANRVIWDLSAAIGKPLHTETLATRESFLQAAQFIGRDTEKSQLTSALSQAINGQGGTWLVSGESGVGKSRLLEELRIHALLKGVQAVRGQASDHGLPYQVWQEPLRRLALNIDLDDSDLKVLKTVIAGIDELLGRKVTDTSDLDPEQAQRRLMSLVASLFHRQPQPVLVILEDMHWAGTESLDLLKQLSQIAQSLPLLIVCSYRDDEISGLRADFPGVHRLKLNRLDGSSVAKLSESMLGAAGTRPEVVQLLQRETEGNAFFLVEVVRVLAEEAGQLDNIGQISLPEQVMAGGIQQIVQRRLSRVPAEHYPLLQFAAILGREVDLSVLKAIQPSLNTGAWLLGCSEATILEAQGNQWRFTHDKLREGMLSAISSAERPSLYRKVAETVEQVHAELRVYAPILANLWKVANEPTKESQYAVMVGEQAYQFSAYEQAQAYFTRALSLVKADSSLDAQQREAAITVSLGKVFMRMNDYAEAVRLLDEGLALAATLDALTVQADALWGLGYTALYQGDYTKAAQLLNQSRELFQKVANLQGVADSLRGIARIHLAQGDYTEAMQALQESLILSQQLQDDWRIGKALSDLGSVAARQGAFDEAATHLQNGLAIYRKLNNREDVADALLNLGQLCLFQENPLPANEYILESLSLSREIGDKRGEADALTNLGFIGLMQQDFEMARTRFTECLKVFEAVGFQWGIANTLTNLGHVETGLGNPQQAHDYFYEALAQANVLGATPMILEIMAGLAKLQWQAGQTTQALTLVGLALNHPASSPDVSAVTAPLLEEARATMSAEMLAQALEAGKAGDLEITLSALLTQRNSRVLSSVM